MTSSRVRSLLVVISLLASGCRDPAPPTATRVATAAAETAATTARGAGSAAMIQLSGRNRPIVFARNGKVWAAAWRRETGRRTRLHIGDTCYEEVFFTLFDDQLKLVLERPLRVSKRRKCQPMDVELVATAGGFAVSPSDVGALFDLESRRFAAGSTFPRPTEVGAKLPALAPQDIAFEQPVLTRSLGGSAVLRAWVGYGTPRQTAPYQLHYEVSPDGKQLGKRGVLMTVAQKDTPFKVYLLSTGPTVSLFVLVKNRISRQRFAADGALVGSLEQLVEETDAATDQTKSPQDGRSIYNVTLTTLAGQCVILYTRGNAGMKIYSCKSGRKRYLGEAYMPTLFCAGDRCVISESGQRIRFVVP